MTGKTEFVYMTVIAAPAEKVWEALTTAEFTREYWHSTAVQSDFRKGSPIEFQSNDGVGVRGEILEADFPTRLSYTWQFLRDPAAREDRASRVTFELESLDVGTRLTVIHDELVADSATSTMVRFGWPHVIAGLKTLLETGEAVDFTGAKSSACPGQEAASA